VAIATALQAEINSNTEVRSEIYEYNLIVCPGYPEVVDEMVALSNTVNDEAFVVADVPCDKTPDQAAVWALTTERVRSPNVAYYYPWGVASNLDGRDVLVAPSGVALRTYAYSDNQAYVWFAPAGVRRGIVTGVSRVGYVTGTRGTATTFVETNLNQGQRDNLYEFNKNINPIVFFPQNGLIVWGQKTSSLAASALDRVNVMRLIMYVKRQLRKGAFPFVFEPNDKITRDNLKAAADGFLNDILAKRGLYDFVTLCDESNNTPDRIDRNEMYLDVALKPVKAAEFIYIPIRVLSTGAQMPS
jgi:phage tail sheath protein FI